MPIPGMLWQSRNWTSVFKLVLSTPCHYDSHVSGTAIDSSLPTLVIFKRGSGALLIYAVSSAFMPSSCCIAQCCLVYRMPDKEATQACTGRVHRLGLCSSGIIVSPAGEGAVPQKTRPWSASNSFITVSTSEFQTEQTTPQKASRTSSTLSDNFQGWHLI